MTAYNKAWAALFGAVVTILQMYLKIDLGFLTPETIEKIVMLVTPVLVYLVPNKAPV